MQRIKVKASETFGTPATEATVIQVIHQPGEIPQYPHGLFRVWCDDSSYGDSEDGTFVDAEGTVYMDIPTSEYMVPAL